MFGSSNNVKRFVSFMVIVCSVFFVFGCSDMQNIRKDNVREMVDEGKTKFMKEMQDAPSVVRLEVPKEAFEIKGYNPIKSADREVNLAFENAQFSVVIASLSKALKLNTVYDDKIVPTSTPSSSVVVGSAGQPQQQQQQQLATNIASVFPEQMQGTPYSARITMNYSGKLGDFIEILSKRTGYFFTEENNSLNIKQEDTFNVIVPNYPDLLKEVGANLATLGARNVGYDVFSSTLSFKSNYNSYLRIKDYLNSLQSNAALVTLRMALINVKLNNSKNMGVDWTQMNFGYKSQRMTEFGNRASSGGSSSSSSGSSSSSSSSGSSSTTGTSTSSTTNNSTPIVDGKGFSAGVAALFGTNGATVLMESAYFTLSSVLNFIEGYGKSSIMQDIFVQTLSGKPGGIEVLRETPYVSQVGVASLSNNSSTTQSTASTEKAKTGVTMKILPLYTKANETLMIKLEVGVFGVTRFLNLNAGNLGIFTQPETTKRTIDTYLRMRPDQVAIIGGLIYELDDQSANGLPIDTYLTKAVSKSKDKEELILFVKPTIIEFVPKK